MAGHRMSLRTHLLVSAAGGAVVNALLHLFLGWLMVRGFRLDWMVFPAHRYLEEDAVLLDGLATGLGVGVVAGAIAVLLTFRAWDHGKLSVPPADEWIGAERTRDAHTLLVALQLGLGLGVFLVLNLVVLFTAYRLERVSAETFLYLKVLMGGLAGAVASWIGAATTARGLAVGRIRKIGGQNLIAATALASSRRPARVLAAVLLLSLIMAAGIPKIDTNVDVADVLPRGNPNTDAAHNLTDKFKSSFTQQVTFHFRANPEKFAEENARWLPNRRTTATPENVTDELYIRAIAQAMDFIAQQPPFRYHIAGSDFYNLINWTLAGGQNANEDAFALPGRDPAGSAQFAAVERGLRGTIVFSSLDAIVSPDWKQTSALILVDPQEPMSTKEIGQRALEVRDAYVAWVQAHPDEAIQVFVDGNPPIFTVDLPIANAHSSQLTQEDFKLLLPFISYFIVVALFLAFRHPSYILVTFSSLAISTLWTFGAMGFMGMKLNTLNLTTVPLIMGVGIDYGIHMMNEYQSNRARGMSAEEAWRVAGGHGAFALFIATLTTSIGLLVMVVSPSLMIAELGLLSVIAIDSCFLLAITFLPAAITLYQPPAASARKYREARFVPNVARHVGRNRVVYAVVLVVLAVAAAASAQNLVNEPFGDPARNYLPDDPIRQEHEAAVKGFYNVDDPDIKANILVFEGNITTPESHAYMSAIEASLRTKERVDSDTLRSVPFLMRTWLTVKGGATGAGQYLLTDAVFQRTGDTRADPYPQTTEEIEDEIDQIHASPLRDFGALFTDYPANEMAIMVFSLRAATYQDAEEAWTQVWEAINENRDLKPADVSVAFVGNTATNYLFVAEEVPWLTYMSIVVNITVFVLVLASTRSLKLAFLVGAANFLTSLFWLGLLPPIGVGMAITLALPLVFIFAMGSDYVLHLGLACKKALDHGRFPDEAYSTYGKGVFYSFLTTLGAFLIFTQISNLAVRKTMIATAVAILMIFITTMLLVPLFYPPGKGAPTAAQETSVTLTPRAAPKVSVIEAGGRP